MILKIHSKLKRSMANGPGSRAVIWLQGCPFSCDGCFNKDLRASAAGEAISVVEIVSWLRGISGITGVTISGGEPTEQLPALLRLFKAVRRDTNLSILIFSGRTMVEIRELDGGEDLLSYLDVLIDGRYDESRNNPPGVWPSSSNQRIHLLTDRYSMADFAGIPAGGIIIDSNGEIIESGMYSAKHKYKKT